MSQWTGLIIHLTLSFNSSRIAELGGPNYKQAPGPKFDLSGKEVPGNRGYKYFGAAKDLPGVRELFSQEPAPAPRKTRAELMRNVDAEYFGFNDEDDGVIIPLEQQAEIEAIKKAAQISDDLFDAIHGTGDDEEEAEGMDFVGPRRFVSHVPFVPSQQDVQDELLRRKKQELMEQFTNNANNATE